MAITKTLIISVLAASAVALFVWTAPATGDVSDSACVGKVFLVALNG